MKTPFFFKFSFLSTIIILKTAIVSADPLYISKINDTLKILETQTLQCLDSNTRLPSNALWQSSDSSVAVVDDNGVVTATNEGNVTISAKDAIGNIASTKVTVRKDVFIKNINFSRTLILVGYGQSIASNNAPSTYTCKNNVFNFDIANGLLYRARDPLIGADGTGGSVWSRLGDKVISEGYIENVIIIALGVNGSSIERWSEDGDLNEKLISSIKLAKDSGIEPIVLLWHQGSTDAENGMTKELYIASFESMRATLRNADFHAPIFVSLHSGGGSIELDNVQTQNRRKQIRDAQIQLLNYPDIFPGVDTDSKIKSNLRLTDNLHFTNIGYDKFADLWIECLVAGSIIQKPENQYYFKIPRHFENNYDSLVPVSYFSLEPRPIFLTVFNPLGQKTQNISIFHKNPDFYSFKSTTSVLPNGVYICQYKADGYSFIKKTNYLK